ncbi:PHO85 cyclin-5 [Penicillium ochrochloron]
MTCQIAENIWPLSTVTSHIDAVSCPIGVLPLRTFIHQILPRGRTSYSTLHVTLYYMIRFHVLSHKLTKEQSRSPSRMRAMHCGRRMFLTALILASKYLQDHSYSALEWSLISGFNTSEINRNSQL